jgi:biopolymer transport protein ExbD
MIKNSRLILFLITIIVCCSSCEKLVELYFGVETEHQPMKLNLPKDPEGSLKIDDKTYTVLVFKNGRTYVYEGLNISNQVIMKCNIGEGYLRDRLTLGKNKFGKEFKVIIKPDEDIEYKNIVDILDEMVINKIQNYSLQDMKPSERLKESFAQ